MEPRCNSHDLSTRYESFIYEKLESYNKSSVDELRKKQIRACFHGWMILSNHPDNNLWSLWNPLTSKMIRLPRLFYKEVDYYECCLSSPPGDLGSVLLLTTPKNPTIVFCRLDRKKRRSKWSKMSYAEQMRSISNRDDCFLKCLTCYRGKVYAITTSPYYAYVIRLDIVVKDSKVVISLTPFVYVPTRGGAYNHCPSRNDFCTIRRFLKGSSTDLFYITICFKDVTRIVQVYLFKLEIASNSWEEVEDLKDAAFFLEYASANSYSVFYKHPITSTIGGYVHILSHMDNIIYSFHVKDRTISLSSMPCIVPENQVLVWATLECYRLEIGNKQKDRENDKVITLVRCDESSFESTTSDSGLLSIPFHMLEMIMERCVGIEYMSFRATCKLCLLAAPSISWSNKASLKRLEMYSVASPWLTVLDNYRGVIVLIDPIFGDEYFIKIPQEVKTPREHNADCEIFCSRYGWLLLVFGRFELVFFNPFTHNMLKLPPSYCFFRSLCFSTPPTSPDCMVVGFATREPCHVHIHFVSQKPSSWRRYHLDFDPNTPHLFHFPIFSDGNIYALCNNERLDVFKDIGEENYSWEVGKHKVPTSCCKLSPTQYFLLKCDHHILLVIMSNVGECVEVFKLNDTTKEWEKIDDLGRHTIYISNTSCICLEAKLPQMENKIFFPRVLQNEGTKIVFYSLETCMYHTLDHKNVQRSFGADLLRTKRHCLPHTWIEPSWC